MYLDQICVLDEETWIVKVHCCLKQIYTGINASAEDGGDLKAVGGYPRLSITGTSISKHQSTDQHKAGSWDYA